MNISEAVQSQKDSSLMNAAAEEIVRLRAANDIMRGKLEMFDKVIGLVKAVSPSNNRGDTMMGEAGMMDIPFQLKERANVLKVIEVMHPNEGKAAMSDSAVGNSNMAKQVIKP